MNPGFTLTCGSMASQIRIIADLDWSAARQTNEDQNADQEQDKDGHLFHLHHHGQDKAPSADNMRRHVEVLLLRAPVDLTVG